MSTKPLSSPLLKLGTAEVELEYTTLALYRMATLPTPFELAAISNSKTSVGALVAWVWACLPESQHEAFPTPAAVAKKISLGNAPEATEALAAALKRAVPGDEKNADGSTRKPSSWSSSD